MATKKFWLVAIILIVATDLEGQSIQWFDSVSIRNTVLLEKKVGNTFNPHGTGFLMWNYKNWSRPIVVTCRHLIVGRSEIYVVVTAHSEYTSYMKEVGDTSISMSGSTWILEDSKFRLRVPLLSIDTLVNLQQQDTTFDTTFHYVTHFDTLDQTQLDIAAFPIGLLTSRKVRGVDLILTKTTVVPRSAIKYRTDVALGDEVYFVGFPFGIGTDEAILCPLVRSGCIAWCPKQSKNFLVDAFSYSGNSGSPIYLQKNQHFIGMILGHLPRHPPTHNWGLAGCVWSDDIWLVVELAQNL